MSKQKKPFSPSESHSYNVNVALALGKPGKAVLLKELYRSYKYFRENKAKELDGFHWFFLRMDALVSLYPEYTKTTMYRWIKELEDNYLIASRSDLNSHGYDRTKWFTVNVFAYECLTLGKTLNWLNSQNENRENEEHSFWKTAIIKMGIAIQQTGTSCSQNEPTIQPCLNPGDNPSLNPVVETSVSPDLFSNGVQVYSPDNVQSVTSEEEKISAKKEQADRVAAQRVEDAIFIIQTLNQFAGRQLPHDPKGRGSKNVDYVVSLLRKKYTVEELELMVQFKCYEWVGTKMAKNLSPITLFKRHGERYVQEAIEAKDNPAFLAAIRKAKEADSGGQGSGLNQADSYTREVADSLQNW